MAFILDLKMIAITAIISFLGRASGAKWNSVPQFELIISLIAATANYNLFHSYIVSALAIIVTYFGIQTGHGNFYSMNGINSENDDPEFLEYFKCPKFNGIFKKPTWIRTSYGVRPLAIKLGIDTHTMTYSIFCMSAKGFVIGLALLPIGLFLAAWWPISYVLGVNFNKKDTALAEWCAFAGLGLLIAIILTRGL